MGFKYKDLAKLTKRTSVDLGDGAVVNFDFRHQMVTPQMTADMLTLGEADGRTIDSFSEREALAVGNAMSAVSHHVVALLTWWDLEEDDGKMFPLDVERLSREIPVVFQIQIIMKCLREIRAGEADAPEA